MAKKRINSYRITNLPKQKDRISLALGLLGLGAMLETFEKIAEENIKNHRTFYDYLESLCDIECGSREDNRLTLAELKARFPFTASFESYDFSLPRKIDKSLLQELKSCRFIEKGENVLFFGNPGVGKTHLAISLARESVRNGYTIKFIKLRKLIDEIGMSLDDDALHNLNISLFKPDLLIIDEMDLYQTTPTAATFLSKVIQDRYEEEKSIIITSNKPHTAWEEVFGDKARAGAIVDRLFHRVSFVIIESDSYRMLDNLKRQRIS